MAGPDLSVLVAAVDFETITIAVLAVFVAVSYPYMAWKGAKMVIAAVQDRYGSQDDDGNWEYRFWF